MVFTEYSGVGTALYSMTAGNQVFAPCFTCLCNFLLYLFVSSLPVVQSTVQST